MRRLSAVAALVLGLSLAGCTDDARPAGGQVVAQSSVAVDTPELREARAATGMADCAPGPGGGALPALTLPCLGGGQAVDLSSLRGPMVLNFWGSWCTPCGEEMPALEEFYESHGTEVPVLGVDWQDQYPASALQQIGERGVTYPSVADPGGEAATYEEFAKTQTMPMTFLLDEAGKIAYVHTGVVESGGELAELVREHLGVRL